MIIKIPKHPVDRKIYIYRFVLSGWLLAFYIKIPFFGPYLFGVLEDYPILQAHFPFILQEPIVAQLAYLFPLTAFACLASKRRIIYTITAVIQVICSSILLLHGDTYNDMTFLTAFWSGWWLVWFSRQIHQPEKYIYRQAARLAKAVVGLIFLGGFIGKLTAEYWSGLVFIEIFLIQKPHWPLTYILYLPTPEHQYMVLSAISRVIILIEGFLSLSPFLPTKIIGCIGPVLILGITIFSSWPILSVILPLVFLLWASLLLEGIAVKVLADKSLR